MYALLDGKSPATNSGAGWAFTPGVGPHTRELVFKKRIAADLMRRRTIEGSSLRLSDSKGERTIKRLTILRQLPTDNPDLVRLVLADRRWLLQYPGFFRVYNRRVRGAATSRQGVGPQQVRVVDPSVGYEIWSLNPSTQQAWEPPEVISDVFDAVAGDWNDGGGILGKDLAPVEGLEAKGKAATAIAQVLTYFGQGINIWCDKDGVIQLLDLASAAELGLLLKGTGTSGARPQVDPGPGFLIQDRSIERPMTVRVLFQPLIEIRLDRLENDTTANTTRTRGQAEPPRSDDVVYLPVDATIDGEDLAPGTLLTLDKFLEWLNGQEPAGKPPLTRDLIRRLWLGDGLNTYVLADSKITNLWASYIPAIREGWRRQFQPRKAWRDRIRMLVPGRVTVLNPQTGTVGGAAVFGDHAIQHTWANPNGNQQDDLREVHEQFRNVFAAGQNGPNNVIDTPIRDLRQAPADVVVKDPAQKVLQVNFRLSTEGTTEQVYRSAIEQERMPTTLVGDGDAYVSQEDAWLAEDFEQSIILSAVMGAPNDKRMFWPVEVGPGDVKDKIAHAIEPALGPVLEIFVSGARVPARFAWDDSRADLIAQAFDETGTAAGAQGQGVGLLQAYDGPVNQAQLQAMAEAIAASVYQQLADRAVGGLRTPAVDLDLAGLATRVSYEWDPRLGAVTDILLAEDGLAEDPDAFLSSAMRRSIDFLVDPS